MGADEHGATMNEGAVTAERGFLPASDPLEALPEEFAAWEALARDLPKLLAARAVRARLDRLPLLDPRRLGAAAELERAMLLLSYFGHAYVWGDRPPARSVPAGVAVPWFEAARKLGRPPVLSYASYALQNWRRLDPRGPIALGNLALLQNFLGGLDEEWFILVHVEIEGAAGPAMAALRPAQQAAEKDDPGRLETALGKIATALDRMNSTLDRMPESCDPYVYFTRVRPYIHGWKGNPALPGGLVYEGVETHAGRPQEFRGETGAQSTIVPSLDAALGIAHKPDALRDYLMEMRDYMPPAHRSFLETLERGPSLREYVRRQGATPLRDVYNSCVTGLEGFRAKHFDFALRYIHQQAPFDPANPTAVGTGGTPFMPYLGKHLGETADHLLQ